jgi:hypothetical protein
MDKKLKKIIEETIQEVFSDAPEKMIERSTQEIYLDICPHCKTEIAEKHEYTEDGGKTWRHSDCKGLIVRPPTPKESIEQWIKPLAQEVLKWKSELPPSGEEKYSKQEPGGTFGTSNTSTIGNV